MRAESMQFAVVTVLTLFLSSIGAGVAESVSQDMAGGRAVRTAVVVVGSLAPLLVLWVVRFLVFETLTFGPGHQNQNMGSPHNRALVPAAPEQQAHGA
jgi:hypothetical protein